MPPVPVESVAAWVALGPVWAVEVLDALTLERQYRAVEQACSDRQRDRILGSVQ